MIGFFGGPGGGVFPFGAVGSSILSNNGLVGSTYKMLGLSLMTTD